MVTLAQAIDISRQRFPSQFQTGFVSLPSRLQVDIAQAVSSKAAEIRAAIPASPGRATFIQGAATDVGNLFLLGQSQIEQSAALARQSTQINTSLDTVKDFVSSINERLSGQVTSLGESVSQVGDGDPFQFIKDSPFLSGIGTGGLIVGGIALLLLLRR